MAKGENARFHDVFKSRLLPIRQKASKGEKGLTNVRLLNMVKSGAAKYASFPFVRHTVFENSFAVVNPLCVEQG